MSRIFDKLKGGAQRIFDKVKGEVPRIYGKVQTQVLNNPRLISTVSRGLNEVGHYGAKAGPIIGSLGALTAQPELVALGGAVSASSKAAAGGADMLKDRSNYLERTQNRNNNSSNQQHYI